MIPAINHEHMSDRLPCRELSHTDSDMTHALYNVPRVSCAAPTKNRLARVTYAPRQLQPLVMQPGRVSGIVAMVSERDERANWEGSEPLYLHRNAKEAAAFRGDFMQAAHVLDDWDLAVKQNTMYGPLAIFRTIDVE